MTNQYGTDPKLLEGVTEEQRQAILNWEAYTKAESGMAQVVAMMREIPVLPSEIPPEDDKFYLDRVDLPDEGGVLTHMVGRDQPFRGFPYKDFVGQIEVIKKITKGTLSGFYHHFNFLLLPLAFGVFRNMVYIVTYTFYRLVERYRIKPMRYSKAIRELHRAFSFPQTQSLKMMRLRLMLREIVCMILEFDNAYRFRAQDLLVEINKESLKKNPIKELNRILTIAEGRETGQQVRDTWKLFRLFNSVYLRFDRRLKRMIVNVLLELNPEEFKLTTEDIHFCEPRKDYVFGFMKC